MGTMAGLKKWLNERNAINKDDRAWWRWATQSDTGPEIDALERTIERNQKVLDDCDEDD